MWEGIAILLIILGELFAVLIGVLLAQLIVYQLTGISLLKTLAKCIILLNKKLDNI